MSDTTISETVMLPEAESGPPSPEPTAFPLLQRAFDIQPGAKATVTAPSAPVEAQKTDRAVPAEPRNPARSQRSKPQRSKGENLGYRPSHVLQRLSRRPGVYHNYLDEAERLLFQIRLVGLGPALAVLLSQTEDKSKRRIYWDLSKWVFKEQRIKGKNIRSLMESVVYGDSRFLLKATQSAVTFLEELISLSYQASYQPQARSKKE